MKKIRYAVLGLGDIAQEAVLPAFSHSESSEVVALVSGDGEKLDVLSKKYKIVRTYPYEKFEDCLMSGDIDAVYIATPNHLHREYTERAARKGVSILCEKPMAPSENDCHVMIDAAKQNNVKLMIAYRLHFDPATLEAIELGTSGKLGELRIFSSVFAQQVKPGNIRVAVPEDLGGGAVWDMGVYCINAARYMFRAEPFEVTAFSANGDRERFPDVDEMTSVIMRFPDDRLAQFVCSFGAADGDSQMVLGTEGQLEIQPAYGYTEPSKHRITIDKKTSEKSYPLSGQFAAEIDYFSQCLLDGTEPEPSGEEGLADVRIVDAIYRSAMTRQPVVLPAFARQHRPSLDQKIRRKPSEKVQTVNASSPTIEK